MYCKFCGKEINDDAEVCVHCGKRVKEVVVQEKSSSKPKYGTGILLCLFLGLIGLIIGIAIYPFGSVERKTFIKGWLEAYIACIVFLVFIYIFFSGIIQYIIDLLNAAS